jgi:hypothetical protein
MSACPIKGPVFLWPSVFPSSNEQEPSPVPFCAVSQYDPVLLLSRPVLSVSQFETLQKEIVERASQSYTRSQDAPLLKALGRQSR